jgi:hypothetical protein
LRRSARLSMHMLDPAWMEAHHKEVIEVVEDVLDTTLDGHVHHSSASATAAKHLGDLAGFQDTPINVLPHLPPPPPPPPPHWQQVGI